MSGYRSLLFAHPRSWRREHGEAVLAILLEVHAAEGRTRPSLDDRIRFALDGLRVRWERLVHHRAARRFADRAALAGFHAFDQQNGSVPAGAEPSATEQVRANAAADGPMPQVAWGPIAVRG